MYCRGTTPPVILSSNAKPSPRGSGLHLDHRVAELAVAAGLLLVPAAGAGRRLDGLAIADLGLAGLDADLEARLQALEGDAQMHLALAEEAHLADVGLVLEGQRRILLDDLVDRARQPHVVLAVLDPDREGVDRLRRGDGRDRVRPRLAGGEAIAGGDGVEPAEAERLALPRLALARRLAADEGDEAADARLRAARSDDHVAFLEAAAQDARDR